MQDADRERLVRVEEGIKYISASLPPLVKRVTKLEESHGKHTVKIALMNRNWKLLAGIPILAVSILEAIRAWGSTHGSHP